MHNHRTLNHSGTRGKSRNTEKNPKTPLSQEHRESATRKSAKKVSLPSPVPHGRSQPTRGQSSSHGPTNAQLRGPSKMAHRGSMRSETHQSLPNQVTGSLSGFRPLQYCATARGPSASPLLDHFFSHLWT